ncbi:MAG: NAD(P)/FAD-dependent oxidoreductase [Oscillospiraceae bacterium]|nr:NAD(P)/FAD-dependent oxidoreductase [Oscillospiraceae bacterium]
MIDTIHTVVIGAGPAGLIAAGFAAKNRHKVTVIEKNARPARKLMITGKGRCNITNNCDIDTLMDNIAANPRFLYSSFNAFSPQDTMALLEELGLELKTERGNRVFPKSDRASDVVDALVKFARQNGVVITQGQADRLLISNGVVTGVVLGDGTELSCDRVIIATGGLSYPLTGSTGDGYRLAAQAGHTIMPTVPSLVPLEFEEEDYADLQGLSLRNAALTAIEIDSGKSIYKEQGEMLFTHFGVSGPLVLSATAYFSDMFPGKYRISVDLKPALSFDQLDLRVLSDLNEHPNRQYANSLGNLLPKKMIPFIVKRSRIDPETKSGQISKKDRQRLVSLLKNTEFTVSGFRPIEEAIITRGGVKTDQINPKTMGSKLAEGLYFAGEVIDVDGFTGGFNLQIAFSTGYLAGNQ